MPLLASDCLQLQSFLSSTRVKKLYVEDFDFLLTILHLDENFSNMSGILMNPKSLRV